MEKTLQLLLFVGCLVVIQVQGYTLRDPGKTREIATVLFLPARFVNVILTTAPESCPMKRSILSVIGIV